MFQTKSESIEVAGVANLQIRSLLDRQQFFDPRQQAQRLGISSAAWPMFGLLWPSAARLAARMAGRATVSGERILELGCGLALPSLVAHRRGGDVTASDRHPLAASFLRHNLRLNALPPMKYRHADWGVTASGTTPEAARFDLIIGSDLLYERDSRCGLAARIHAAASTTAEVWIVDPDRGNRVPFSRKMRDNGFDCREERLDIAATATASSYRGRLLVYRRGPGP